MYIGLKIWELLLPNTRISEKVKAFKRAIKSLETFFAGNARFKNRTLVLFSRDILRLLFFHLLIAFKI